MQLLSQDAGVCKSATRQINSPMWIVRGPYRIPLLEWGQVHRMALQGWAAVRRGNEVYMAWADVEEGRA